jgi:FkbM family methyltransferase
LPDADWALRQILTKLEISVIFDVGAHVGQYAARLRHLGYRGRIVSFEPREAAFAELHKRAMLEGQWQALRTALARVSRF